MRAARLGLQLRRHRPGIGPEEIEPEGRRDLIDGLRAPQTLDDGVADVGRRRVFADAEETARERGDRVEGERTSMTERAGIVRHQAAGALTEPGEATCCTRAASPTT